MSCQNKKSTRVKTRTPRTTEANIRYTRTVDELGYLIIPEDLRMTYHIKDKIGYQLEGAALYLSTKLEKQIAVDKCGRILLPDEFERVFIEKETDIEECEMRPDGDRILCIATK